MSLPVIIGHAGYSPYLEFTLRQARVHVPADRLYFLGDETNDRFDFLSFFDGSRPDLQRAADRIAAVYEHRSTNTRAFELSAFQRWFRVHALMEAEGLRDALVLDSDIFLYTPPEALAETWFAGCEMAVSTPEDRTGWEWVSSGHSAYWTTARLGDCCGFMEAMFTEPKWVERLDAKWEYHRRAGISGGICDMTAFYLYRETQPPERVRNVATVRDGTTFDHNVNRGDNFLPDEYRVAGASKSVQWRGERPWGVHRVSKQEVRFHTLHLQGQGKGLCGRFYRGDDFAGRGPLARRLARYYAARTVAGRVKASAWRGLGGLRNLIARGR